MAEEKSSCQECRRNAETPFGVTMEGQPAALICWECRRRASGNCTPTSRIERDLPTMVRVDVRSDGSLDFDPLFSLSWPTFRKKYPRLTRIFSPPPRSN
ncbi:hypothetical protein EPN90_04085 [Patescibacteria group bacterium]|nr:MAG: hypothetical protein EPN90_04085 [Patescibacteria group bacterium]